MFDHERRERIQNNDKQDIILIVIFESKFLSMFSFISASANAVKNSGSPLCIFILRAELTLKLIEKSNS